MLLERFGDKDVCMERHPDMVDAFHERLDAEYKDNPKKFLKDIKHYIEEMIMADFGDIALNFVSSLRTKEADYTLVQLLKHEDLRYTINALFI